MPQLAGEDSAPRAPLPLVLSRRGLELRLGCEQLVLELSLEQFVLELVAGLHLQCRQCLLRLPDFVENREGVLALRLAAVFGRFCLALKMFSQLLEHVRMAELGLGHLRGLLQDAQFALGRVHSALLADARFDCCQHRVVGRISVAIVAQRHVVQLVTLPAQPAQLPAELFFFAAALYSASLASYNSFARR